MKTLQDLVTSLGSKHGIAKSWRDINDIIQKESFNEYHQKIMDLSNGFMHLGIKPKDHVMYIADNNPDWAAISLAINNIGAVDVPRGTESPTDELIYILRHCDAKFLFVKDELVFNEIKDDIPRSVKEIVSLDNTFATPISQIRTTGVNSYLDIPLVGEDDLSGIIYTSGTTGKPKGVMLTHKNFISNFPVLIDVEGMRSDDLWLSGGPLWHVFPRAAEYSALSSGGLTHHSIPAKVKEDLVEIHPTILPSVPRVWESVYSKGMRELDKVARSKTGLTGILFRAAIPNIIPKLYIPSAMKKAVKEKLGGSIRFAVSGGGALPAHIDDFFRRVGVEIIEGYGMTETSPVIAARIHGEGKKSRQTVGYPLPNVKVRIVDPDTNQALIPRTYGEVQVSGDLVMKGYYKDDEATNQVFVYDKDGTKWFKTGDRGRFNKYGHLKLDGRYKDTIIGTNGENVDPSYLENKLKKYGLLENSMVFKQEGSKHLYALVAPNEDALKEFCVINNIKYQNIKMLHDTPKVQQEYNSLLKIYNGSVKPHHKINAISLLDTPFGLDEITATAKLKRKEILKNRREAIEKLVNPKK